MLSIAHLILLLSTFFFVGFGISSKKIIRDSIALVPILGYVSLIGLSYFVSANLKISGSFSVLLALFFLASLTCLRFKAVINSIHDLWANKNLTLLMIVAILPMCTILLPAIIYGFSNFYGDVNFDFFYNSQDSWYLQSHNVLQFSNVQSMHSHIIPLDWSADKQGRFGISLLGSFAAKYLNFNALEFNSLLLNTIVILFAFVISDFCRNFFGFRKKSIILAVLLSTLSAAYVQSYSYYLLGQLSAIPVFLLYCVLLEKLLSVNYNEAQQREQHTTLIYACLALNILYVMYAILFIYAIALTLVCLFLQVCGLQDNNQLRTYGKLLLSVLLIFIIIRLLILPESLSILKAWIETTHHVTSGKQGDAFIVCSEYLTSSFLALFFGLSAYPSSVSVFSILGQSLIKALVLSIAGIIALAAFLCSLRIYINSEHVAKSAKIIIVSLSFIVLLTAIGFFATKTSYAIFKTQTWFIPILILIYFAGIQNINNNSRNHFVLSCSIICILILNLIASASYLNDMMLSDSSKMFVGIHGVTGNKDLKDISLHIKRLSHGPLSLFLTNGIEESWLMNSNRDVQTGIIAHNEQPLGERLFTAPICMQIIENFISNQNLLLFPNQTYSRSEITDPPLGGQIVYKNQSYELIDPATLKSFLFIGKGSYPVELIHGQNNNTFPNKFRWIEKGVEVYIYNSKDSVGNLVFELTPGYVVTKSPMRRIDLKINGKTYHYTLINKTRFTQSNIKLHKGFTCLTIESPDEVSRFPNNATLFRKDIALDQRVTNFALSYIAFHISNIGK